MEFISKQQFIATSQLDKLKLDFTAGFLMKVLRINKINKIYSGIRYETDLEFLENALKDFQVRYEFSPEETENLPQEGAFITVSNHPYGLADGMILLRILLEKRPDFKVMANYLLEQLEQIRPHAISVNPFETMGNQGISLAGIRRSFEHLQQGCPLGIFPAGEVSTLQKDAGVVADKVWEASILKFIAKAKVPVVPIYFEGYNSKIFHWLGKIHPTLRTAKLPSELLNKKDQITKVRIGKAISVKEQAQWEDPEKLGRYLRAKTYALGSGINVKKFFRSNFKFPAKPQPVAEALATDLVEINVDYIREKCLVHTHGDFEVFIAHSQDIPHILQEIGRLREVTFREVGEGTNNPIDLDEYDLYYYHLFIWHKTESKIVGAYRMGKGREIFDQYGVKGLYIRSLFKVKEAFHPVLKQSIELGRSFIIKEYQQKPMPLFLLWKGILYFLLRNPQYKYLIGPVSISNSFSNMSKHLIIAFIKKHFYDYEKAQLIQPKKEFEVKGSNVDVDILLEKFQDNFEELDKFIQDIEPNRYRLPVLLKKYIKQNARIIGFNIDPMFNDSLDGLILLDVKEVPEKTIEGLKREFKKLAENQ
ncbi:GNAT family N-acyltransferase [Rapidithrix thailandica]|uniref:GNAT family N-acyltransferase n=1 Tax=Rapidithrix thailandica TaxID=413964 RepID=A0AAW9S5G1_9BACT